VSALPPASRDPILAHRVRTTRGDGFSFIPNRFLRGGFFASLSRDELALYLLLVLAGDRQGVSFYHYDTICSLLTMRLDDYLAARDALIDKDLIAYDGTRFQLLSLPERPLTAQPARPRQTPTPTDPAQARRAIRDILRDRGP
jgi:hypothetical protein